MRRPPTRKNPSSPGPRSPPKRRRYRTSEPEVVEEEPRGSTASRRSLRKKTVARSTPSVRPTILRRPPLQNWAPTHRRAPSNRWWTPPRPTWRSTTSSRSSMHALSLLPGPMNLSPMMAARTAQFADIPSSTPAPRSAGSVDSGRRPRVERGQLRAEPAWRETHRRTRLQPPLIWGLLAFARREFDNFFSALAGRPAESVPATVRSRPASRSPAHR